MNDAAEYPLHVVCQHPNGGDGAAMLNGRGLYQVYPFCGDRPVIGSAPSCA